MIDPTIATILITLVLALELYVRIRPVNDEREREIGPDAFRRKRYL